MPSSRYVVGIDLGTTNCALAYVDTQAPRASRSPVLMPVPQVVDPGVVEDRPLLPSFLYLPGPASSRPAPQAAVGRRTATTASASSPAPSAAGADPARRLGEVVAVPLRASTARRRSCRWKRRRGRPRASRRWRRRTRYLKHLAEAWNSRMAKDARRAPAGNAGHRPDRAGVVRRRGARTDRRGRPRRRARDTSRCWRSRRPRSTPGSTRSGDDWREQVEGRRRGARLRRRRRHDRLHA